MVLISQRVVVGAADLLNCLSLLFDSRMNQFHCFRCLYLKERNDLELGLQVVGQRPYYSLQLWLTLSQIIQAPHMYSNLFHFWILCVNCEILSLEVYCSKRGVLYSRFYWISQPVPSSGDALSLSFHVIVSYNCFFRLLSFHSQHVVEIFDLWILVFRLLTVVQLRSADAFLLSQLSCHHLNLMHVSSYHCRETKFYDLSICLFEIEEYSLAFLIDGCLFLGL